MTFMQKRKLSVAALLGSIALTIPGFTYGFSTAELSGATSEAPSQSRWDAVALGRVEPRSGEIKLAASVPGRIAEVLVKANDKVFAGELLIRLDDEEVLARLDAADARATTSLRLRDRQIGERPKTQSMIPNERSPTRALRSTAFRSIDAWATLPRSTSMRHAHDWGVRKIICASSATR
jgi:multidrug efflux pump subunit AcrA (membrane-fusion protein)